MHYRNLVTPFLVAALAACGGGGGSAPEAAAPAVAPAALDATVGSIVPGATMAWTTGSEQTLRFSVLGADGQSAVGAGLRVFTLSRTSPHDGSALEEPVPLSLLGSTVTDSAGSATLELKLPAHVEEVLIVATLGDMQGKRVLAFIGGAEAITLTLDR